MALKDYPKFKKCPVFAEKRERLRKMRKHVKTMRRAAYKDALLKDKLKMAI